MVKGEDAVRRKKNKLNRKKMRKDEKVSTRIAGIIAAKQRRKSGKRRISEGMCFSLPTPEDPFNDGYNEKALNRKKAWKLDLPQADVEKRDPKKGKYGNRKDGQRKLLSSKGQVNSTEAIKTNAEMQGKGGTNNIEERGNLSHLPTFLKLCLDVIERALLEDTVSNIDKSRPKLFDTWGAKFLECCLLRVPILETTGACFSTEQIACIVSTAANLIDYRKRKGLPVATPFLLILVASQEKAVQVRLLCKPLKDLGIHTVSLHSGASLDHQIHGLKSREPAFLVSTPERLLELVSLKAVDITKLSFLVVDGLETFAKCGLLDALISIRRSICEDPIGDEPKTVIFFDNFGSSYTSAVQNIVNGPIYRLSLSDSIASQSACITQYVHVCAIEERAFKSIKILDEQCSNSPGFSSTRVLFIVENGSSGQSLVVSLNTRGYNSVFSDGLEETSSKSTSTTVTDLQHVKRLKDITEFEFVILLRTPPSIDDYIKILTKMARHSHNAELHCFFGQDDEPLAGPLIDILKQCGQTVPESLSNYCKSSPVSENRS